ncbi:MAG: phosphatase PAP2 family protein [Spirochaetia bacterium]|nr:phosphatase PAP2 family protein [Spirochaetia bacterium]
MFDQIIQYINILDKKTFEFIIVFLNYDFIVNTASFIVHEKKFIPYLISLYLIFLFINYKRALLFLAAFLILLGVSEIISSSLKSYFMRERPSAQTGILFASANYSFPSAHAFNSMAIAWFLSFWFQSKKNIFIGLSFIIGISRVLANYHFPFDVLAGWIGGFILGYSFQKLLFFASNQNIKRRLNAIQISQNLSTG